MELARKAAERVARGYYQTQTSVSRPHHSLVEAIEKSEKTPLITEIKYASPSSGTIRGLEPALGIARAMLDGGACGLSILTDPDGFRGEIGTLREVAGNLEVPVVMKDIVVSPSQLRAAAASGADAVVLIAEVFSKGLAEVGLEEMILEARRIGLEVLAEANGTKAFAELREYQPELLGINNRNLSNFRLELSTTEKVLAETGKTDRPVVSESGISSPADIRRLKAVGADAFLVGTSIMTESNIEAKVRELVNA